MFLVPAIYVLGPLHIALTLIMLIRRQFYSQAATNIAVVLAEYGVADVPDRSHLKRLR